MVEGRREEGCGSRGRRWLMERRVRGKWGNNESE